MVTSTGEAADPAAGRRQVWSMQAASRCLEAHPLAHASVAHSSCPACETKRDTGAHSGSSVCLRGGGTTPGLENALCALHRRRALWILEVLMGLQLSVEAAAKAFKLRATWLQVAQQQKPKLPVFRPALA